MKPKSSTFAEAYASWLSSVSQCCSPLLSCLREDPVEQSSLEKQPAGLGLGVVRDQPALVKPLETEFAYDPFRPSTRASGKERIRKSFQSTRTSLSVKRRLRSSSSTRGSRPQISAPTNFRHVFSESFQFPEIQQSPSPSPAPRQPNRRSFQPLQLSIYQDEHGLSPILPDLPTADRVATPPPVARLRGASNDEHEGHSLKHERSYSSMSFHIPRRRQPEDSPSTTSQDSPPQIPPKSRARAFTSPESEQLAERIASALLEKEKLQKLIDEVVERQSIYLGSRPSTAHSMAYTVPDEEPMPTIPAIPAIPALPPVAPSFAERLSPALGRPNTAPSKSPIRPRFFDESPLARNPPTPTRITYANADRPLQPPLPLVLRPPLRKKKSFSRRRVSSWLFPAGEHQRDLSFDSVTNQPRPVKGDEGFYQCVAASGENSRRQSVSSASSWSTEDDEKTVPTSWSPGSSSATKTADPTRSRTPFDRTPTFGVRERPEFAPSGTAMTGELRKETMTTSPRRERVGVAF